MAERFAAEAERWFAVERVEPRIWLVAEPGHVFSWLIGGSERTVLLDTGLGIADIASVARPLAPSPITVVNSHVDYDHVGGNVLFERVMMHELGPRHVAAGCDPRELEAYASLAAGMRAEWERVAALDREGEWFLLGPAQEVRPWPAAGLAATGGWRIEPPPPSELLADGALVELGDRTLRVIHTPGHAAEHICLLDEREGILWAQDQAYYGPQLLYMERSDPIAFARVARLLADLAPSLRAVYVAHCLRPSVPPGFLVELADAAEQVAAGDAELRPAPDPFGIVPDLVAADHGHFSILLRRELAAAL